MPTSNRRAFIDPKQQRVDLANLRAAHATCLSLSKDPSTKVGARILGMDGRSSADGYNGMVAGMPEPKEVWHDRDLKYPRVIHAEINALLNCPFDKRGATIFCTLHPCAQCLKAIVQAGIVRVVHYGPMWEREPHPEIVAELSSMVEIVRYDDDPIVEGIKLLFENQSLPANLPVP